jgi:O6-methylguanine-DNA--protein-cysteine methyltransferase
MGVASITYRLAYSPVGRANGRNPLAIAVPCHRVLQKGGGMCGYGGGIWRKEYLLDLEGQSGDGNGAILGPERWSAPPPR